MASKKKTNTGLNGAGFHPIWGKDVDDIINDIASNNSENSGSINIPVKDIRPNPYQPRKIFDEEALKELAASIEANGVFTPILVRKSAKGYELITGERRLRASKIAKKEEIPAVIVEFNDQQMMEISLLENIQRENLNAIEEASGYDQLIRKLNYTQDDLAKRLGKSRSHITNSLRLLKLPQPIQKLVQEDKITYGHARALINIEDEETQISLAERIVKEGLSVREIEKLSNKVKKTSNKKIIEKNPYMEDVRMNLEKKLSTKVELNNKTIVIHYNGTDDLNRILDELKVIE